MDARRPSLISVPDRDLYAYLLPSANNLDLVYWQDGERLSKEIEARIDGVILPYAHESSTLSRLADLPNLAWVQTQSTGFDHVLEKISAATVLSNAAGVHAASTAELAIGLAIASMRNIHGAVRNMASGTWVEGRYPALADHTVLVIGSGNIGEAIVSRLMPFEVDIKRVGRRRREDARGVIYSVDDLSFLLPSADVVMLALPLNAETNGLVDTQFLAQMKTGALLVNVGRGGVVCTDALVNELVSGRLRAALDVTDPEPLPPDHPLWRRENVIITPHLGGNTSAFLPRIRRLLRTQISRLSAGEMPVNIVRSTLPDAV